MGEKGKLSCANVNFEKVSDLSECKRAAQQLEKTFKATETEAKYPKGCYIYRDKYVYWNTDSIGGMNKKSSVICKSDGNYLLFLAMNYEYKFNFKI